MLELGNVTKDEGSQEVPTTKDFSLWQAVPHHLAPLVEKLSRLHPSGIAPSQLETPMMKQFSQAKEQAPDALLFFRMGDFFELFGIDAILAADICNLTLTSRDKNSVAPIPMAGVPVVSYKNALRKCLKAGFKVAVCDQIEDPKQAKLIVRREIVRIATPAVPGDLGEAETDNEHKGCYLSCFVGKENKFTFASVDVSTGDFRITGNLTHDMLIQEILTHTPKEILCPPEQLYLANKIAKEHLQNGSTASSRADSFEPWIMRSAAECQNLFQEYFGDSFAQFKLNRLENSLQTIAGILSYLRNTQKHVLKNLSTIEVYELRDAMLVDDASKRHLDFFASASGERKGSLYWLLNKCFSAQGARVLYRRLNYPFIDKTKIQQNLNAVEEINSNQTKNYLLEERLRGIADIDRLLSRCAQGSIDPRSLAHLGNSLTQLEPLLEGLKDNYPAVFKCLQLTNTQIYKSIWQAFELGLNVKQLLCEEPPTVLGKQGGEPVFAKGYSQELDNLIDLEQNLDKLLLKLEEKEKSSSGINNLRIGYTRAFGYYFEVSKGKTSAVPKHFIKKQTLTNGDRFITPELKELEERALAATEDRIHLEKELFGELLTKVVGFSCSLKAAANFLGELDVLLTFARLALQHGWTKPVLCDEQIIELEQVSHPVLATLSGVGGFVPNDVRFGGKNGQVLLITGPNMAGKSTLMRTVALTQIMFQIGCFVPAQKARLGLCEHLFTRIGSGDFQLKNQSTFMVEMLETAHILQSANAKSLILMDEIGRGTSTFDGLSLAWAILEDLHDRVKALTLFSTHYHEVLAVAHTRPKILPMQMEVIEKEVIGADGQAKWEIYFTRRFIPGAAGKSYGLHVAQMAGIAEPLLTRAAEILQNLEEKKSNPTAFDIHLVKKFSPKRSQKELQRNMGNTLF